MIAMIVRRVDWGAVHDSNDREFEHHDGSVAVHKVKTLFRLVVEMNCTSSTGNSEAGVNAAML